jgi:hypothetical protein
MPGARERVDNVDTLSGKCSSAFAGEQDFLFGFASRPEILQGSQHMVGSSAAYTPPPADCMMKGLRPLHASPPREEKALLMV